MIWNNISDKLRTFGLVAIAFSIGMWVQSSHDDAAVLPQITQAAQQVEPLKVLVKKKDATIKEVSKEKDIAGCERDVAVSTAELLLNGVPTPVHCAPNIQPKSLTQ